MDFWDKLGRVGMGVGIGATVGYLEGQFAGGTGALPSVSGAIAGGIAGGLNRGSTATVAGQAALISAGAGALMVPGDVAYAKDVRQANYVLGEGTTRPSFLQQVTGSMGTLSEGYRDTFEWVGQSAASGASLAGRGAKAAVNTQIFKQGAVQTLFGGIASLLPAAGTALRNWGGQLFGAGQTFLAGRDAQAAGAGGGTQVIPISGAAGPVQTAGPSMPMMLIVGGVIVTAVVYALKKGKR